MKRKRRRANAKYAYQENTKQKQKNRKENRRQKEKRGDEELPDNAMINRTNTFLLFLSMKTATPYTEK